MIKKIFPWARQNDFRETWIKWYYRKKRKYNHHHQITYLHYKKYKQKQTSQNLQSLTVFRAVPNTRTCVIYMSLFLSTKTRRLSIAEPVLSMATSMTSTWKMDNKLNCISHCRASSVDGNLHDFNLENGKQTQLHISAIFITKQQQRKKITDRQCCRFTCTSQDQQIF